MNPSPLKSLFEKYVFKRRAIYAYPLQSHAQDERVLTFAIQNPPDAFLALARTERLHRYLESRMSSPAWRLFVYSESGIIQGYSFLHVPKRVEWHDSLPTFPGEARETSTFVEPEHRGKGIRGIILEQQKSYCIKNNLTFWCVIENVNTDSIRSTVRSGGTPVRDNYLIKLWKRNVLSILTRPLRPYFLHGVRRARL